MSENGRIYRNGDDYFRARGIGEGRHLSDSRSTPGAKRGLVRDDATNKLVGHADFVPVEDWELTAQASGGTDADSELHVDDLGLGGALAGLALVGLTLGAVAAAGSFGERKKRRREQEWERAEARRRAAEAQAARITPPADWYDIDAGRQQWWDGQGWTEHVRDDPRQAAASPGWYDDGSGRLRWFDGQDWTDHFADADGSGTLASLAPQGTNSAVRAGALASAQQQHVVTMTSAEWQERVRAMLLARAFSEEQWRLLSHARIEDGDGALLQWQSELAALTPQEFSDRIVHMLDAKAAQRANALEAASAGWYDDGSGRRRWWDGRAWTDQYEDDRERVLADPRATATPEGWYGDGSGSLRWWDGLRWTEHRA